MWVMKMKNKKNWLKYVSTGFTILMIVTAIFLFKDCDVNTILSFTPKNLILASIVMMGIYAVKSLSVIFPASVLIISSGLIYSFGTAIAINVIGVLICFTISYFSGRLIGKDALEKLLNKYPKIKKVFNKCRKNNILTAYAMRVTGIPTDIGSMFMGASEIPYRYYLLGSFMGMMPKIIFYTAIGNSVDGSLSTGVIVLLAVTFVVMLIASFIINKHMNKKTEENI